MGPLVTILISPNVDKEWFTQRLLEIPVPSINRWLAENKLTYDDVSIETLPVYTRGPDYKALIGAAIGEQVDLTSEIGYFAGATIIISLFSIKRSTLGWDVIGPNGTECYDLTKTQAIKCADCLNRGESAYAWLRRESLPLED